MVSVSIEAGADACESGISGPCGNLSISETTAAIVAAALSVTREIRSIFEAGVDFLNRALCL